MAVKVQQTSGPLNPDGIMAVFPTSATAAAGAAVRVMYVQKILNCDKTVTTTRLYAPSATQIDSTHLSLTFAGYGVQTPNNDLLNYRRSGNVVLTVSKALPAGVPNNINAH